MCLRQYPEIALLRVRSKKRSAGNKHILNGSDTHVKIRGEGVEDLMGAHMRVGVNDTLSIALDTAGYD